MKSLTFAGISMGLRKTLPKQKEKLLFSPLAIVKLPF
jgi:hypothetical protein